MYSSVCWKTKTQERFIKMDDIERNLHRKSLTCGTSSKKCNSPKSFLYNGLPCVCDGLDYLIFSPYALKLARIPAYETDSGIIKQKLEKNGFFGSPCRVLSEKKVVHFGLILSTGCNLRCKYCYTVPNSKPRLMTPKYAIRIIKDKIKTDTEEIYLSFFGGEPTLNMSTLKAAVEFVSSQAIRTYLLINTNGTCSDKDLDYLIKHDFVFSVSSDGLPRVTDEQRPMISGDPVSEKIERTITRLVENRAIFQIRPTLTRESLGSFQDGLRYWASLGVKFIHFEPVYSPDILRVDSSNSLPPGEYVEYITSALDEAERLGIYIISSPYMNLLTPSEYFCTTAASENELYTPDGAVSACYRVQECEHCEQEFIIGKYDTSSDTFIRYQDRIDQLSGIQTTEQIPCSKCCAKYICAGGCPLRNKTETGRMTGVDEWMCYVKKRLVEDAIFRIEHSVKNRQVPIVFGESIFERLVADNPSIKGVE